MPRILLFGDDFSTLIAPRAAQLLEKEACIYTPPAFEPIFSDNRMFAKYQSFYIDDWCAATGGNVDIAAFSCGLWDTWRRKSDAPCSTSLSQYAFEIGRICDQLKAHGSKIIFSTMVRYAGRRTDDIEAYNGAAKAVVAEKGGYINDLYRTIPFNPTSTAEVLLDQVEIAAAASHLVNMVRDVL